MAGEYYTANADFNPVLLRKLLLAITVSPEIGKRFGVPVAQLEDWLRDLADHLSDWPRPAKTAGYMGQGDWTSPYRNSRALSAGEIRFLLDGFDEMQTVGD